MTRKAFSKNIKAIKREEAHGGAGARQVLLSQEDGISKNLEAVTKGFLKSGQIFDWHDHDQVDEFWIVLQGAGYIEYKNGQRFDYKVDDVIYNPANLAHKIEAQGEIESEYLFVRLKV